VATVSALAGAD